jgi:hypothetical protein
MCVTISSKKGSTHLEYIVAELHLLVNRGYPLKIRLAVSQPAQRCVCLLEAARELVS